MNEKLEARVLVRAEMIRDEDGNYRVDEKNSEYQMIPVDEIIRTIKRGMKGATK